MKFQPTALIAICTFFLFSCSKSKTIELPLTQHNGYGYFRASMVGVSPYNEDENDPWRKTNLEVTGVPEAWSDVKHGHFETNIRQSVYQNYHLGNFTEEWYEKVQKSWDWQPDTLQLSKGPLKTKIAFAYTQDSTGVISMIVDANNNLDFSDDEIFTPIIHSQSEYNKGDSTTLNNFIDVTYERFTDNKITSSSVPLYITYYPRYKMLMSNFAQYSTANFNGIDIAVSSDNFTNLTYNKPIISTINDSLKERDNFRTEELVAKNEYIEIKGSLFKNIGVNTNKNVLILERIDMPKNEIHSTQIGYKTFPFAGNDVKDQSPVSLDGLKGKYVLLDFWAVWCGPCLEEMPALKELYKKTDRDKFEIVGIVGDSEEDALKSIIEKESITWTQILSTESNEIKEDYGVTGYPTTYLIDPQGVIVGKNLRGKQLECKVLELLKK